jgi:trk system potassium uptake protein TrkA
MNVIIIGGGRLGKQLANTIANSVIVECEKEKIAILRTMYGEERVIEGTGTSEEVLKAAGIEEASAIVIATNSDHTNYVVALIADRYEVPKIIVRVDNPENVDIFYQIGIETVMCPAIIAAKMINSALYPDAREISEIHVFEDSPLLGKCIGDIGLSKDAMVAAVLRGHHFIKPDDDLVMERGDHLIVCSTSKTVPGAEDIISGGEKSLRPFDNILAVLKGNDDLTTVLEEALCLTGGFDIKLTVASHNPDLIEKAASKAAKSGFGIRTHVINSEGLGELGWLCKNDLKYVDCVAFSPNGMNAKGSRVDIKEIMRFIKSSNIPVLISRGICPYKKILTMMGFDDTCQRCTNFALKVAMLTGADLHVMNYRDPEDVEQEGILQIKRMGRMYGIDVKEEVVEGNPTIEFVSKITSGDFDLAVINWDSTILKKNVLKRMFYESPLSILVYTK